MENRKRILKIRDLTISFQTDYGRVKAIRGVNLDCIRERRLQL